MPPFLKILVFSGLLSFTLWCSPSEAALIPTHFQCTSAITDRETSQQEFSHRNPVGRFYVNLIHLLCGEIGRIYGTAGWVGKGFHSRPQHKDPASASTESAKLIRKPRNKYDYTEYPGSGVVIKSTSPRGDKTKANVEVTTMWPEVMSNEDIVQLVTDLAFSCKYIFTMIL